MDLSTKISGFEHHLYFRNISFSQALKTHWNADPANAIAHRLTVIFNEDYQITCL